MKKYPIDSRIPNIIKNYFAVNTKEFRNPMKGEYFLSGAIPRAYKAPNDLSYKYYIAKIIKKGEYYEKYL